MSKNFLVGLACCAVLVLCAAGCTEPQPQPLPIQPIAQPVPQPVVTPPPPAPPPPPPPTPLVPLPPEEPLKAAKGGKGGGIGGNINAPIPGKEVTGDEYLANYTCKMDIKGFKLPLGMGLPPFGCRIFRDESGTLRIGPSSESIASLRGEVKDPKDKGFFIVGSFQFPGNKFAVKARMVTKDGKVFAGKGQASLNEDKATKLDYTLTMTKI